MLPPPPPPAPPSRVWCVCSLGPTEPRGMAASTTHVRLKLRVLAWEDVPAEALAQPARALTCRLPPPTPPPAPFRWKNHLDPRISRQPWTAEEDKLVEALRAKHGNQWKRIAMEIPGRWVGWRWGEGDGSFCAQAIQPAARLSCAWTRPPPTARPAAPALLHILHASCAKGQSGGRWRGERVAGRGRRAGCGIRNPVAFRGWEGV